uniref:THAP-type domain-containing protein n=1 Tax=Heliothis virescens TaxID=7102 RepID=A0A2A4J5S8_HELVI
MSASTGLLCAVHGCRSSRRRNTENLSFFYLPKNEDRRRKWAELIGRPDLAGPNTKIRNHFVCALHFDSSSITYTPKLKPDALPSISLPSQVEDSEPGTSTSNSEIIELKEGVGVTESATQTKYPTVNISAIKLKGPDSKSESVQTSATLSYDMPRKRKLDTFLKHSNLKKRRLQNELDNTKRELQSKESNIFDRYSFQTEDEVTKRFGTLIKWQQQLKNKNKSNRFTPGFKLFALNLHFSSPHTYRSLKTFLSLPSESTLHGFKMIVQPKLEDRTLDFLASKLKSMPEDAKYCTLCLDEMVLKRHLHYCTKRDEIIGLHNINGEVKSEIASHACVIMLRGIIVNWKQPIAYSFLGSPKHYNELEHWINEIILKLTRIGIKIMAIVSDQASNFDRYAKQVKKVSKDNPYFLFNDQKIYYIFDVPHLIKCIRNNLLTHNFVCDDKKISWEYIELMYSSQKENMLGLIPKLTDAHINPNTLQKMRVKYAAQVFSRSVYATMNVLIANKTLPEEAKATAEFVEKINNLFDVLNSITVNSANKYKNSFSQKIYQINVFDDAVETFSRLRAIDSRKGTDNTNRIKTFKNLQITVNAITMLFKDLKKEGFKYLFTRRLNQDCLENFFGSVRQQGGNCRNPTAIQFQRAFSKLFLCNMLKNSPNAICEEDICELLQHNNKFLEKPTPRDPALRRFSSAVALKGETDYRFDLPTQNALVYIAGYLLYKCHRKHICDKFVSECNKVLDVNESRMYSHFKAFNKDSSFYGRLKVPSDSFCSYVKRLETAFVNNFEQHLNEKPGTIIYDILKKIPFEPFCPCFPHDYLIKLFVRFRIFTTIKLNNRDFSIGKKCINHFIKIKHVM